MMLRTFAAMLAVPFVLGGEAVVRAQIAPSSIRPDIPPGTVPDEIPGVGVDEQFDRAVPMDAILLDHEARSVRLGDFFDGERPVILSFVYHQCASFCDMALRAIADSLARQPWTVGNEITVITLSIDPRDGPAVLRDARQRILGRYGRAEAASGWHFLAGTEAQVRRVAESVGYRYVWDERTQQFAHPGAIVILRPDGRPSRYLYGLDYPHNDLRLALIEADEGRHAASLVEQAILYCYRWDHSDGRYVIAARRLMRLGGIVTVVVLGAVLVTFWRRERAKDRERAAARRDDDRPARES